MCVLCAVTAMRGATPVLHVVGTFQNWNLAGSLQVAADADEVYSFALQVADAGGTSFKMSFSGNTDWNVFDHESFGIGSIDAWQPGIYPMQCQVANSRLPQGDWVVTVYGRQRMVALSAKGAPVPTPGPADPTSGTLPVMYITVYDDNGQPTDELTDYELSHKNYFKATYWLDLNGCEWIAAEGAATIGSADAPLDMQIKARGNYTRTGFSKKPFKIKLDKKQTLLGLSKSKHFALMAHADDSYASLRNFAGFTLGARIGLPWTPSQQPVEVVINGDYRGLYFLTESIRIDSDRIDIREGNDNETEAEYISGGYLVELDNYPEAPESQIVMAEKSCVEGHYLDALRITFDTPEVYSELQRRFVTEQFTAMNDAVGECSDDLWRYLDLDDAARYYMVRELVSDVESFHGSTYLFRDHGEGRKWHLSPLWDMGNAFNGPTDGYFYNHDPFGNTWIPSMCANPTFMSKVRDTWMWFMTNGLDDLAEVTETYVNHIAAAQALDQERWTSADIPRPSVRVGNPAAARQKVLDHIAAKARWLATQWGAYAGLAPVDEPRRDTTEAAPLPEYARTGVESVTVDRPCMPDTYYNLLGQPVAHPAKGALYVHNGKLIRY